MLGAFSRDGRPIERAMSARMMAAAPHRGPDGARAWTSERAMLGHQHLRTLPEDVPQPIVDAASSTVITFDGRLDNRQELIAILASGATAFRTPSDAELALAAYLHWGEKCAVRLLGDFAFAIWDGPRERVFCARDAMGVKPFYYHLSAGVFVWASELCQIVASGVVRLEPNEGMIAEFLAKMVQSQDETLYAGIMRLPAAHSMTVSRENVRVSRYWQIDPTADVHHRTDGDYAEHFFSLFKDAVFSRMRSPDATTGAYLSGGLDSSSVVGMTQALRGSVETFSLIFEGFSGADESGYIDDVVRKWDVVSHKVVPPAIDGDACLAHVAQRRDRLDLPNDLVSECLMARMRDRGMRVVLTGAGGDYCFSGSHYHYADMLRRGDFSGVIRQLRADPHVRDTGWSRWQPILSGVRPIIPSAWREAARPLAKRLGWMPELPNWIDPALTDRVALEDRLRTPAWVDRAPTFGRRHVCELFASGWQYLLFEDSERSASEYGLDERHPFFDRRLIEFGVGIPEEQRWQGRETKYVVRRAMSDLLPASVATRNGKGDFNPCVAQAVEAIGGASLFDGLHIASLGWVKQEQISALYRRARRLFEKNDEGYCDAMFKLWMVGGIELWYRSVFLQENPYGRVDEAEFAPVWSERPPRERREGARGVPFADTH
jgi:asparagine synthase (glutamine-hydrolysing)